MQFAACDQKFEEVSKSHWFSCRFVILSRVIAINTRVYTYDLDSMLNDYRSSLSNF